jgi:hypothetical protein
MIFTAYDFLGPHMIFDQNSSRPWDLWGLPPVQIISNLVLDGLSTVYIDICGYFLVKLRQT